MKYVIAAILFTVAGAASAAGVHQKQIQAAQVPATGPEGPVETALRKCFVDAQGKDNTPGGMDDKLRVIPSPRAKFIAACIDAAGKLN